MCGVPQGLMTFRGLISTAAFIFMRMISRFITHSSVSDLQRYYYEITMDLKQIHEWATANGLKLNPEKSQVILIHRCSADPPPILLIGAYVVKVVSRVKNLGFVFNERLTATDLFRKVCQRVYWILRSLRPHAAHTPFDLFCRSFCHMSTMVILCLLVLIPHRRGD
jgi:hypothetical protein